MSPDGFLEQGDSASQILGDPGIPDGVGLEKGKLNLGGTIAPGGGDGVVPGRQVEVGNEVGADLVGGEDLGQGVGRDGIPRGGRLDHAAVGVAKGLQVELAHLLSVPFATAHAGEEALGEIPQPVPGEGGTTGKGKRHFGRDVLALVPVSVNESQEALGIGIVGLGRVAEVLVGRGHPLGSARCIKGLIQRNNAKKV